MRFTEYPAIINTKYASVLVIGVSLIGLYLIVSVGNIAIKEHASNDIKMELQTKNDMNDMNEMQPADWRRVFNFVPNGLTNCKDLFADIKPRKSIESFFPSNYIHLTKDHSTKLSSLTKNVEGYSAENLEQPMVYWKLAGAPFVKTVCETGFNAGHSTLVWLSVNPNTHVYSFDIGQHSYSRPMAEFIQNIFPGRLNVTWGSSVDTLPLFHSNHADVLCDLVVIDGGHTRDVAQSDISSFKKFSARQNILVLDDYPSPRWKFNKYLGPVWEEAKQAGQISEIFRCSYLDDGKEGRGFSVGRYDI